MPNSLGSNGLVIASRAEVLNQYNTGFQVIYGPNINLGPSTPDGQMINIFLQSVLDLEDLLLQIYNTFDPDNAFGTILDERVAINGIQRQAGTFTTTNITLTLSQSVNLFGLDQTAQPVYTVADGAGNQWQLQTTVLGAGPGSAVLLFQSAVPGAITTVPNTITVPVTIILGVTNINNPTTFNSLGINEETDAQLKIRRQKSVSLPSKSYFASMFAALENVTGVTFANIVENFTGATDIYGIPGHSIWVIVAGSGSPSEIANAIYINRPAGCGLFNSMDSGAQSFNVTQADGSTFVVYWDDVLAEDLFIRFTATSLNGINPPNIAAIRGSLPTIFTPGVFAEVNINELATLVQQIDPNTLVTLSGFSATSGGSYTNTLTPASPNKQFSVTSPNIIIIPMILSPSLSSVPNTVGTVQFSTLGGFGTYTYSISVNNSGGSINSLSGAYTAGSTPGTDTVLVTDAQSHTATATVQVT